MQDVVLALLAKGPSHVGLFALLPATLLLVAVLTAIPSHRSGQRPAAEALRAD